jgi:tRNA threonylcarbamoyladenosine modification (KEOPS) complex Cgi121 subunit
LLKYIKEFEKYVLITGFRNVQIKDTEKLLKKMHEVKPSSVELQIFNAKFVATWQHVYFAVLNALTAFRNKDNISKSLAMEILIYASAQRQILKAMRNLGIRPETSEIALVIVGDNSENVRFALSKFSTIAEMQEDETVLKLTREKVNLIQERFEISDLELKTMMGKDGLDKALTNLVIERMALLATQR